MKAVVILYDENLTAKGYVGIYPVKFRTYYKELSR